MTLEAQNNGIPSSLGPDGLCGTCRFRAEAMQIENSRKRVEVAHLAWEVVIYAFFPLACLAAAVFANFRLTYEFALVYGLATGAKGLPPLLETLRKAKNGSGQ